MRDVLLYNLYMKGKRRKTKARYIFDLGVYCTAVLFLFFSVVLFMLEFEYSPQEAYTEPPPMQPSAVYTPVPPVSEEPTAMPFESRFPEITVAPQESESVSVTPEPTLEPTAEPTPTNNGNNNGNTGAGEDENTDVYDGELRPVKLYFIEKRISCDIVPVGISADHQMETTRSAYNAGWLSVSPYVMPGDMGKAIIAGHNRWGGRTGVFSVLKKLKAGETVAVGFSDGYARYFKVDEVYECAYNDNSVMEAVSDRAQLVLITCKGDWSDALHTSQTRVVAICSPAV